MTSAARQPIRMMGHSEIHRKPTPWPRFDVEKFARDSEKNLRAAEAVEKSPTGPPPAYHPASIPPGPGAAAPPLDTPARALRHRVAECARRVTLVHAELASGGLSTSEAAHVLSVEIGALEGSGEIHVAELAPALIALRTAVEQIGGIDGVERLAPFHVLVVDDEDDVRERVALAVETLGHVARSVAALSELAHRTRGAQPHAIFLASRLRGPGEEPGFCNVVRELARAEGARVVVYTTAPLAEMDALARECGADDAFRAHAASVAALASRIALVLEGAAW